MKARFNLGALADLADIGAYIAVDNPTAAADLVEAIEQVATLIGQFPKMGQGTNKQHFRKFPVGKYLLVYEITHNEVVIHYVRHSARQ